MNTEVEFTATAERDLREILTYLMVQTADKETAIRFTNELRAKCKLLEDNPEIGAPPRDRLLHSLGYRFLVYKSYLIFYIYDKKLNTAYIHAVIHSKRDYMRIMKNYL